MKEDLNTLYNSLLELQTEEELTNYEIKRVEEEFDKYLVSHDHTGADADAAIKRMHLIIYAENLKNLDEAKEKSVVARNKLITWLIAGAIFIAGMIPVSILLNLSLPLKLWLIFGGWICNSIWHNKIFRDFFATRRDGEEEMEKMSENNEEYQKLFNLWKKAHSLKEEKETHHRKLEKYKKKFVKLLENMMQDKYNEMGIHRVIKIERASLIPGSSNGLKLELKAPKEEKVKDDKES